PLVRRAVIPGCNGDDKIEVGHDEQSLSAIAEATHPAIETWLIAGAIGKIANVPLVAIATLLVDAHARLRAFAEPFRGQKLAATGSATGKHELADARQVARRHAQPRGRDGLAVAWPVACGNPSLLVVDPLGRPEAERIEQGSARVIRQ